VLFRVEQAFRPASAAVKDIFAAEVADLSGGAFKEDRLKLRIVVEGKAYEVEVDILDEATSDPVAIAPEIQSSVLPAAGKAGLAGEGEEKIVRSPLAGLVVRVYAEPGQQVKADDLLMVLEAMKMETNINAPIAGKIKSVDVSPGHAVKLDQILLQFE
jgi:methylmalonyl-CoA carboxyltransferase 1.3S subunit